MIQIVPTLTLLKPSTSILASRLGPKSIVCASTPLEEQRLTLESIREWRTRASCPPSRRPSCQLSWHTISISDRNMGTTRLPLRSPNNLRQTSSRHDHQTWPACQWRWKGVSSLSGTLERCLGQVQSRALLVNTCRHICEGAACHVEATTDAVALLPTTHSSSTTTFTRRS